MSLTFTASASASATDQTEAPAAEATWQLGDGLQQLCLPAERNYRSYFIGILSGHWDTALAAEVRGFPEGTVVSMRESIPPGDSSDPSLRQIWIGFKLPPLDYGEYPATLYVTDGTVTQTTPFLIKAQDEWGCYP